MMVNHFIFWGYLIIDFRTKHEFKNTASGKTTQFKMKHRPYDYQFKAEDMLLTERGILSFYELGDHDRASNKEPPDFMEPLPASIL